MKAYERLLNYVSYRTPSDENSETVPSSKCQFALADALVEELKGLGVTDAAHDDMCYVYGHIPATPGHENATAIGFVAHMDTVADFCDHDCSPIIHENYSGEAIELGTSGLVLSPESFPHLKELKGQTLITSDGTTILGADDKAGIAEIMTAIELMRDNDIPHGPLSVAFTPDEEIGRGADKFDVPRFNAKYAYTLDGDWENEVQCETFNAATAKIHFIGESVHPGSAKNVMINAAIVAMEFNSLLPAVERPEHTEGHEGFYHLTSMSGTVTEADLVYLIRDHDATKFQDRQDTIKLITKHLCEKYGEGSVTCDISVAYRNMAEVLESCPEAVENAKQACRNAGMEPLLVPVRGGTDGSKLSFMGLPCPNLGTGGEAYHGPYEHITTEAMDKSVDVIIELVKLFAEV